MNLLLLYPKDFITDNQVMIDDERREHLLKIKKVQPGACLAVGLINSAQGLATVISQDKEKIILQVCLDIEHLYQQIPQYQLILLGETHDNIRHHQLQAQFIDFIGQQSQNAPQVAPLTKNSPSVIFEMLNQSQQNIIDEYQQLIYSDKRNNANSIDQNTDIFAEKVHWEKSFWPEWSYYRPVFYNTIKHQMTIIAGNLGLKKIRKVIKQGSSILAQDYQDLLARYHRKYNQPIAICCLKKCCRLCYWDSRHAILP